MQRLQVAIRRTMKHTITILSILISFLGYSQDHEKISVNEGVSSEIRIIEVVKIAVSKTTTVYTFVIENKSNEVLHYSDMKEMKSPSTEITDIINIFLTAEGVTECSFDEATQTFTIVTGPSTDLTSCVNKINKK